MYVVDALTQAEANRFQTLVRGQTPHVKLILRALAGLTESRQVNSFRTAEIYDLYTTIADREGSEPLSHDRVTRLLEEQSFLGITESEYTGGGPSEGSYIEHRLMRYPDVVLEALGTT